MGWAGFLKKNTAVGVGMTKEEWKRCIENLPRNIEECLELVSEEEKQAYLDSQRSIVEARRKAYEDADRMII